MYPNAFYTRLEKYLSRKIDKLNVRNFNSQRYTQNFTNNHLIPDYELLSDNKKYKFQLEKNKIIYIQKWLKNNNNIHVNHHRNNGTPNQLSCIAVTTKNKSYLKLLEEKINEDHIDFWENKNRHVYKIFKYQKNEWYCNPILTKKTFDNIFVEKHIKYDILNDIKTFLKDKERFEKYGWPYKRGYLLSGKPGTGKTSLVYAILDHLKWSMYYLDLKLFKNIEVFEVAISNIQKNSLIFIDDIDTMSVTHERSVVKNKKKENNENENKENELAILTNSSNKLSLGNLLNFLDGYSMLNGNIIICATNHPERLDPALIRPGRMDKHYKIDYMSLELISEIIKFYFNVDYKPHKKLDKKISSSEFINTIIMPNIDNLKMVKKLLNKY